MAKKRKTAEKEQSSAHDYAAGSLVSLTREGHITHVLFSRISMAAYCGAPGEGWIFGNLNEANCEPCRAKYPSEVIHGRR